MRRALQLGWVALPALLACGRDLPPGDPPGGDEPPAAEDPGPSADPPRKGPLVATAVPGRPIAVGVDDGGTVRLVWWSPSGAVVGKLDATGTVVPTYTRELQLKEALCAADFDRGGAAYVLTEVMGRHGMLTKIAGDGTRAWAIELPHTGSSDVASGPAGDALVAASSGGSVTVTRVGPDGQVRWSRSVQPFSAADDVDHVAAGARGDVYVSGSGWVTGAGPFSWLAKLDGEGEIAWTKRFGGALAGASDGGVFVVEHRDPESESTLVLDRMSAEGTVVWTKRLAGGVSGIDLGVSVDGLDRPWVAGRLPQTGSIQSDVFLHRRDETGASMWTRHYGDETFSEGARALAFDGAGLAYVVGVRVSASPSSNEPVGFLARVAADGSLR